MNIQHSSRSDRWCTPSWIVSRVQDVLGHIDLDPASEQQANTRIRARHILTETDNGLTADWVPGSVYCNTPGGKEGNKSRTSLFWRRLMRHRAEEKLTHAIFMAFSAEALQTSQGKDCPAMGAFVVCVPKRRIAFDYPAGNSGKSPSHSNAIIYVPGTLDRRDEFAEAFEDVGSILAAFTRRLSDEL